MHSQCHAPIDIALHESIWTLPPTYARSGLFHNKTVVLADNPVKKKIALLADASVQSDSPEG